MHAKVHTYFTDTKGNPYGVGTEIPTDQLQYFTPDEQKNFANVGTSKYDEVFHNTPNPVDTGLMGEQDEHGPIDICIAESPIGVVNAPENIEEPQSDVKDETLPAGDEPVAE